MKVIAIANQKGGVGKTTSALNIGYGLWRLGRRVLLCDLDPQASLTLATCGDCGGHSLAEVLGDIKPGKLEITGIIRHLGGVDLAPGDLALSNSELGLVTRYARETILKKALAPIGGQYDVVILDCGPSLGLLTTNALAAADGVIAPTLPTALDLRGLKLFLESLGMIQEAINFDLDFLGLGVLVCQFEERLNLHRAALEDLKAAHLPILGIIKKTVRLAEKAGQGMPVTKGELYEQYKQVSERVDQWLKLN